MGKASSLSAMQRAIINYIDARIPKDTNKAQIGTIRDNSVIIGNKKYRANTVNDMYFDNGDAVVCLIPNSGNFAAVVGKV